MALTTMHEMKGLTGYQQLSAPNMADTMSKFINSDILMDQNQRAKDAHPLDLAIKRENIWDSDIKNREGEFNLGSLLSADAYARNNNIFNNGLGLAENALVNAGRIDQNKRRLDDLMTVSSIQYAPYATQAQINALALGGAKGYTSPEIVNQNQSRADYFSTVSNAYNMYQNGQITEDELRNVIAIGNNQNKTPNVNSTNAVNYSNGAVPSQNGTFAYGAIAQNVSQTDADKLEVIKKIAGAESSGKMIDPKTGKPPINPRSGAMGKYQFMPRTLKDMHKMMAPNMSYAEFEHQYLTNEPFADNVALNFANLNDKLLKSYGMPINPVTQRLMWYGNGNAKQIWNAFVNNPNTLMSSFLPAGTIADNKEEMSGTVGDFVALQANKMGYGVNNGNRSVDEAANLLFRDYDKFYNSKIQEANRKGAGILSGQDNMSYPYFMYRNEANSAPNYLKADVAKEVGNITKEGLISKDLQDIYTMLPAEIQDAIANLPIEQRAEGIKSVFGVLQKTGYLGNNNPSNTSMSYSVSSQNSVPNTGHTRIPKVQYNALPTDLNNYARGLVGVGSKEQVEAANNYWNNALNYANDQMYNIAQGINDNYARQQYANASNRDAILQMAINQMNEQLGLNNQPTQQSQTQVAIENNTKNDGGEKVENNENMILKDLQDKANYARERMTINDSNKLSYIDNLREENKQYADWYRSQVENLFSNNDRATAMAEVEKIKDTDEFKKFIANNKIVSDFMDNKNTNQWKLDKDKDIYPEMIKLVEAHAPEAASEHYFRDRENGFNTFSDTHFKKLFDKTDDNNKSGNNKISFVNKLESYGEEGKVKAKALTDAFARTNYNKDNPNALTEAIASAYALSLTVFPEIDNIDSSMNNKNFMFLLSDIISKPYTGKGDRMEYYQELARQDDVKLEGVGEKLYDKLRIFDALRQQFFDVLSTQEKKIKPMKSGDNNNMNWFNISQEDLYNILNNSLK